MLERRQLEKLLVLNGVEPTAADEEIRSVLVQARWDDTDVAAALMVLRENTNTHETHVDTLHKVFRTDERMKPETINALLGIDIDLSTSDIAVNRRQAKGGIGINQLSKILVFSISLSVFCIMATMWFLQVGIFHQTQLY